MTETRETIKIEKAPPEISQRPEFPEEGSSIGKYHDLSLIGKGGQAAVFKAFDKSLSRYVALKILNRGERAAEKLKKMFMEEIQIQAQLALPGIVPVFECGEDRGWIFFAMELVEGKSIDEFFCEKKTSLEEKVGYLARVAVIVSNIHKKGLTHRDIKPRNVMIDIHGELKLLDLGLATIKEDEDCNEYSGTPAYMAPEQCQVMLDAVSMRVGGKTVMKKSTEASDVYSLGVMSYELLTGHLPYEVDHLDLEEIFEVIKNDPPAPMTQFVPEMPPEVEFSILHALHKAPGDRPSAEEFAEELELSVHKEKPKGSNLIPLTIILAITAVFCSYVVFCESLPEGLRMPPLKSRLRSPAAANPADEKNKHLPVKESQERPQLYVKDFPENFESLRDEAMEELKNSSSLKGKGALIYSLPPKSTLLIKHNGLSLIRVNSAIQKDGCFYRNSGKKAELVIKTSGSGDPKRFDWIPQKGKVDILY